MADDDRVERALDALGGVPAPDRWDEVVARAVGGKPLAVAGAERRPRRWLAVAALLVAGSGAAGAVAVLSDDDEPTPVATRPSVPAPCGGDVPDLAFEHVGDDSYRAEAGDQVVEVTMPYDGPASDVGARAHVGDRRIPQDIEGTTVTLTAGEPGLLPCETLLLRVTGPDGDANARLAEEVALALLPPAPRLETPCGSVLALGVVLRPDGGVLRGTDEGIPVTVEFLGPETLDVPMTEQIFVAETEGATGTAGDVHQLRMPTPLQPPCDTIVLTGVGASASELIQRTLVSLSYRPPGPDPCEAVRLASPPVHHDFEPAGDGRFEAADGRALAVRAGEITGGDRIPLGATGPWDVTVGDVDGDGALEFLVPIGDTYPHFCRLVAVADGGTDVADLTAFLNDSYLAADDGRPRLVEAAVWPETAQEAVGEAPPADRDDPSVVAADFAEAVLGWADAEVLSLEDDDRFDRSYLLEVRRPGSAGPPMQVTVSAALGGRWLSVTRAVSHADPDAGASVSVQGRLVEAHAELPPGAVSSSFRFDYGGRVVAGTSGSPVDLGFDPDTAGSVVVLFRDGAGVVVGAWATTLPAGDFAAG